jgi:YVTN family beta-propeller protein
MNSLVGVSMLRIRAARVAFALLLMFICTSCGETYRPVAFPIIPTPPNPGTFHFILALSGNGMNASDTVQPPTPGSTIRYDTSGDTVVGIIDTGAGPVHAAVLPSGAAWYAANSLEDTITVSTTSASSTRTTIALPDTPGDPTAIPPVAPILALPVFVHTTENSKVYVANYNYGTVSVINASTNVVIANVGVDPLAAIPNLAAHPVALAELPNGQKVYSANQGNGSVTVINTVDDSVGIVLNTVGSSPVSAAARSDSQRVYVLDRSSGNISVIDPTTTPDTVIGTVPTAAGADYMLYDSKRNRLYVMSSGDNALWAFDAVASVPTPLFSAPLNMVPPAQSTNHPCSTAVSPTPVSLVALPDGSRVYVASYQKDTAGGNICSEVSVFTSANYTAGNVISLGSAPIVTDTAHYPMGCETARPNPAGPPMGSRISITSSADNKPTTRVYVADCDQGNTSIITTVAINSPGEVFQPDNLITQINAPLSAFPPPSPPLSVDGICPNNGQPPVDGVCPQPPPPPQNPLFIVAGP